MIPFLSKIGQRPPVKPVNKREKYFDYGQIMRKIFLYEYHLQKPSFFLIVAPASIRNIIRRDFYEDILILPESAPKNLLVELNHLCQKYWYDLPSDDCHCWFDTTAPYLTLSRLYQTVIGISGNDKQEITEFLDSCFRRIEIEGIPLDPLLKFG